MDEHATQPGSSGLNPESQEELKARLQALEQEALRLGQSLSNTAPVVPKGAQPSQPDKAAAEPAEPEEEEAEEQDLTPPPPEVLQQVENLIRRARIEGQRGQKELARKLLQEAQTLAPNAPDVLEIAADDLASRRRYKEAGKLYRKAFLISKSPVHERKWGEMLAAGDPAAVELAYLNESEFSGNPKTLMILSVVIPWLGQIVGGQYFKGGGLLALYIGLWLWAVSTPNGIQSLLSLVGINTGVSGARLNAIVLVPLAGAALIHLVGIFDAASNAKKIDRKLIDRPKPPVDLPFD